MLSINEQAHRAFVRNRTADRAASDRNELKGELDHYASYFTAEERQALVDVIQALERLLRTIK
jgi:hypothetical protein